MAGFHYFDVMPRPPPVPSCSARHHLPPAPPPLVNSEQQEGQEEGESNSYSFEEEKGVVDEFCVATLENFVARQQEGISTEGVSVGASETSCHSHTSSCGCAQGEDCDCDCVCCCGCIPLLQDLNLSYNRFRSLGLLAPLLKGQHIGLSCLTLMGNRYGWRLTVTATVICVII